MHFINPVNFKAYSIPYLLFDSFLVFLLCLDLFKTCISIFIDFLMLFCCSYLIALWHVWKIMQNMANLWTPTYHFTGYDFLRAVLSALSTSSVHNDCQKNNLLAKISICPALTCIKYPL